MALERTKVENTIIYVSQFTQYRIMFTEISKQNILKTFKTLQYFGHLMIRADSLEKTLMLGKDWRQKEAVVGWGGVGWGGPEDDMIGWHQWLNGCEFEQTLGDSEGRGAWSALVHGVVKSWTPFIDWKTTKWIYSLIFWMSWIKLRYFETWDQLRSRGVEWWLPEAGRGYWVGVV